MCYNVSGIVVRFKIYDMIDLLKQTDRECTIALQQPNRDIDAYRAYYEGRQSLAKELLLKWQQCSVSGSLAWLNLQLRKVDEEITKVHYIPFLLDEAKLRKEKIISAISLISELSANDR